MEQAMVETQTIAGTVDVAMLHGAIACASSDRTRAPALLCVAFVADGDRFDVQATDSHVAFWTGDKPADSGHLLVEAKALAGALKALGVKPGTILVASFADGQVTLTAGPGTFTLPVLDASFPRLEHVIPTASTELASIVLGPKVLAKVIAAAKAVGYPDAGVELTFSGHLKPVTLRFHGNDDAHMVVMPIRK